MGRTIGLLGAAVLLGVAGCATLPERSQDPSAKPTAPEPESQALRIVSLNTWLLPYFASDVPERMERMPAAIRALEADVVCLQEVWLPGHRVRLHEALRATLPYHADGGGGLLTLSRHPIESSRFTQFAQLGRVAIEEQMARKGVLEAQIRTPLGPLRVLNTHLITNRAAHRQPHADQIALLARLVARDPDLPVVLCGDLNLEATHGRTASPGFEALSNVGLRATLPPGADTEEPRPRPLTRVGWPRSTTRSGWAPDFVLVRDGADASWRRVTGRIVWETPETALSDHNGVYAEWRLEGN